tara:strand:+ start:71 stop:544 length:474 start_codon:yes stop_codon:yes gene_type:complete
MYKIATTQAIQKIKILYQFSIKKLFNLLVLFLFSCSNNLVKSEDIIPEKIICGNLSSQLVDKNINFISKNSENFEYILSSIDKDLSKDDFNLIVFSDSKPSSGYKLKLNNIKKKNSTHLLNFINTKPPEGSTNLAVITYPYCVLNVENLNKFKITIN